jgi:hypothetical protein
VGNDGCVDRARIMESRTYGYDIWLLDEFIERQSASESRAEGLRNENEILKNELGSALHAKVDRDAQLATAKAEIETLRVRLAKAGGISLSTVVEISCIYHA